MTGGRASTGLMQRACIECGFDLAAQPDVGRCPRCRRSYDKSATILLDASPATRRHQPVHILLVWLSIAGTVAGFGFYWLAAVLAAMMVCHLIWTTGGLSRGPRRLAATRDGVYLLHGEYRPELKRWHLFEEARIRAAEDVQEITDCLNTRRWKLTLVNGYKPSISSYLHCRGTDELIYTPSVEFCFDATHDEADRLERTLQARIDAAKREYRALRLKSMGEIPPDPHALLHLSACPACDTELAVQSRARRCPGCGFPCEEDMFLVRGVVPRAAPGFGAMTVLFGLFLTWILLTAQTIATLTIGAVVALLVGTFLFTAINRVEAAACRLLVSATGVEVRRRARMPQFLPWSDVGTLRTAITESGHIRLAFWNDVKSDVRYSPLLFSWLTRPGGSAAVDMIIGEPRAAAELICREIERRRGARDDVMACASLA